EFRRVLFRSALILLVLLSTRMSAARAANAPHPGQQSITGRVVTADQLPLAGVSIAEKGVQNTAVTDEEGRFSITAASLPTTLVLTYIGYTSQEVHVASTGPLTITMEEDLASLDEVVVRSEERRVGREGRS